MMASLLAGIAAKGDRGIDPEGNIGIENSCWIPQQRRGTPPNPEKQSKAEKKRAKRQARNLRMGCDEVRG